jgi:hypothetical protein
MSSVIYPVEITKYHVSVQRGQAEILLEGIEEPMPEAENAHAHSRHVGRMTFGDSHPISDHDFMTRGGTLQMDRPLAMFPGILHLLQQKSLFLHGDGIRSTSLER